MMRRALFALVTVCTALASSTARADDAQDDADARKYFSSSLGFYNARLVGLFAALGQGTRPAALPGGKTYDLTMVGLDAAFATRLGSEESDKAPGLGTRFSFESGLRLFYAAESPRSSDTKNVPVGGAGRIELAARPYAWSGRMHGAFVFHAGGELSGGGDFWWSNGVRLAPIAGARVVTAWSEMVRAELDYTLVPTYYLSSSPDGLDVDRLEHRVSLRVAYGRVGLGGLVTFSREDVNRAGPSPLRAHGTVIGAVLELR